MQECVSCLLPVGSVLLLSASLYIYIYIKKKLITNKTKITQTDPPQKQSNKWITFTFHGPPVHKITNLLRKTGLKIVFRPTNTIFQQQTQKTVTPAEYINLNVTQAIKLMLDNPVEQHLLDIKNTSGT